MTALAAKGGQDCRPRKDTFDRFHHTPTLLLHRRHITPQPTEFCRPNARPETATDLLLHFQHPQITL